MHWLFVAVHTCTNFVFPYVLPSSLLVISAMELALALEKLVNEKLHNLHSVRYSPVMQLCSNAEHGFRMCCIILNTILKRNIWWNLKMCCCESTGGIKVQWSTADRLRWEWIPWGAGKKPSAHLGTELALEMLIFNCYALVNYVLLKISALLWKVEAIKKISEYVAQLRRVGKGHG